MSINLSEDAVHALNRSAAAAARDGDEAVAPIHILAGVVSERDPALLAAVQGIGLSLEDLPPDLLDAPATYGGHLPFTPESHQALAAAVEFAGDHGGSATTSAHLLLGVAQTRPPDCSEALDGWGLEADQLAGRLAEPNEADAESVAEASARVALASSAPGSR